MSLRRISPSLAAHLAKSTRRKLPTSWIWRPKTAHPIIGLNDSGGARIQEGVVSLDGYGHMFYRNSIYSGVVPQISVIMGPCAGGAVYSPAITDFIFMVEGTSQMFITGPKVIETVTGEKISSDDLGGARVQEAQSGVAHFSAPTEADALAQVRRLLTFLPIIHRETPPHQRVRFQRKLDEDELADIRTDRRYKGVRRQGRYRALGG